MGPRGYRVKANDGSCQSLVGPGKIRVRGWRKSRAKDLKTGGQQIYHVTVICPILEQHLYIGSGSSQV